MYSDRGVGQCLGREAGLVQGEMERAGQEGHCAQKESQEQSQEARKLREGESRRQEGVEKHWQQLGRRGMAR